MDSPRDIRILNFGICHLSIVPLRQEQSHQSEMVSQLLYGELFKIIETRKKWVKIRSALDRYEGWVAVGQFQNIDPEKYKSLQTVEARYNTNFIGYVTDAQGILFPLPLGANLAMAEFLEHQEVDPAATPSEAKGIVSTAFMYLNSPYLWGGKTPFGIDCSGFTQMVYRMNHIDIPRDAYQQAEKGTTLSFIEEAQPGDLAFFDNAEGKIVHVGILLENNHIIHAFGQIRIDRIDQTGIFNQSLMQHTHRLRFLKSYH